MKNWKRLNLFATVRHCEALAVGNMIAISKHIAKTREVLITVKNGLMTLTDAQALTNQRLDRLEQRRGFSIDTYIEPTVRKDC